MHIGIEDQHGTTKKSHVRSVLGVRTVGTELGMLLAIVKPWVLRFLAGNLLISAWHMWDH